MAPAPCLAEALREGFVPAGRIQSAAGSGLAATLINCFVPPIGDSIAQVDDGHPGIYTALTEASETMRRGGVGYDFWRIRPRGAWVGSTQSRTRTGRNQVDLRRPRSTAPSVPSRKAASAAALSQAPTRVQSIRPAASPPRRTISEACSNASGT